MKLAGAIARFLDSGRLNNSTADSRLSAAIHNQAVLLLTEYFSSDAKLSDVTPSSVRDFLSRWYVEKAALVSRTDPTFVSTSSQSGEDSSLRTSDLTPAPLDLLDSIEEFVAWADRQTGANNAAESIAVINELRGSLPRALEITSALTSALRARGGAFTFPEFLTSFEEGGSSQYDIDVPGNVGGIDGYFRVVRVEGPLVEGEELISEERLWPILFPADVAGLLEEEYIVNMELLRKVEGWQIAGCGFAYPPGTAIR
jgi:hypothetical protein